jgi:hypothetical protein
VIRLEQDALSPFEKGFVRDCRAGAGSGDPFVLVGLISAGGVGLRLVEPMEPGSVAARAVGFRVFVNRHLGVFSREIENRDFLFVAQLTTFGSESFHAEIGSPCQRISTLTLT